MDVVLEKKGVRDGQCKQALAVSAVMLPAGRCVCCAAITHRQLDTLPPAKPYNTSVGSTTCMYAGTWQPRHGWCFANVAAEHACWLALAALSVHCHVCIQCDARCVHATTLQAEAEGGNLCQS
jgi:hypothetical protein